VGNNSADLTPEALNFLKLKSLVKLGQNDEEKVRHKEPQQADAMIRALSTHLGQVVQILNYGDIRVY
jgi:hypothetical protein